MVPPRAGEIEFVAEEAADKGNRGVCAAFGACPFMMMMNIV